MAALYLISYDIAESNQDYEEVIDLIKTWKGKRVLFSQWVILSRKTAEEIRDALVSASQDGDRILVSELTQNTAWSNLKIADITFQRGLLYARE